METINISKEQVVFLEMYGNTLHIKEDDTYYYIPYFFKKIKPKSVNNVNNKDGVIMPIKKFEIIPWEKMPKKLIKFINKKK